MRRKAKVDANQAEIVADHSIQIELTLIGQVRGGKNNLIVTRTGHRFPRKSWAIWRDDALRQLKNQRMESGVATVNLPCFADVHYFAGDKRRRDVPAVIDAIWHVLEKSGVVSDDALIKNVIFRTSQDAKNPRVELFITAPESVDSALSAVGEV